MLIERFQIRNFRSLKNASVPGLTRSVVFHGPNNTGKSNLLHALETVFASKLAIEEVELPAGVTQPSPKPRETPFWSGRIRDFQDNFYMGLDGPIHFEVSLSVPEAHMTSVRDADALELKIKPGHDYHLVLSGQIVRVGDDGEMLLDSVLINRKVAFRRSGASIDFLPSSGASAESKQTFVRTLLETFSDSVYIVPSSRYLARESATEHHDPPISSPEFKNWLHHQSLSRSHFQVFDTVRRWFNERPFSYGDISFLREGDRLEIMVDDGRGYRMPIESKGTGVQQMLVLLGYIAVRRPSVIGIEEPEINLSFANQDAIVSKLASLVHSSDEPPYQLLITSHSDHIGSRSDLKQYHVDYEDDAGTTVRRFTTADRLQLFPRFRRRVIV